MVVPYSAILPLFFWLNLAFCIPAISGPTAALPSEDVPNACSIISDDDIEAYTLQAMEHLLEKHHSFLQDYARSGGSFSAAESSDDRVQSEGLLNGNGEGLQFQVMGVSTDDVDEAKLRLQEKYPRTQFEELDFIKSSADSLQSVLLYYASTNNDDEH